VVLAEYYIRMDFAGAWYRDYKVVNHRRLAEIVALRCMVLPVRLTRMVTRPNHNNTRVLVCHILDMPSLLVVAAFHKHCNS
jgi:hypothetical protein